MSRVRDTSHPADELLESAAVGRLLGITGDGVRALARRGRLVAAVTTSRGWRLYRRADIERVAADRKAAGAAQLLARDRRRP